MLRIALRLAEHDAVYDAMALKFAEHFAAITDGMAASGMWDWREGFRPTPAPRWVEGPAERVRSIVGLIPILAAAWDPRPTRLYDAMRATVRAVRGLLAPPRGLDTIDSGRTGFAFRSRRSTMLLTVLDPERLRRDARVLSEGLLPQPARVAQPSKRFGRAVLGQRSTGESFRVDHNPRIEHPDVRGTPNWRGPVGSPINHLVVEASSASSYVPR